MNVSPKRVRRLSALWFGMLLCATTAGASSVTINFDNLQDSEFISTQYTGLTFTNAIAETASISLFESEFPPHSSPTVAADYSGPMRIDFSTAVSDVGGYFTYAEPLLLIAFDAGNVSLGSIASKFSSNFVSSGNPPNELLLLPFNNIRYVTFLGDPAGGSFALDDLTYNTRPAAVPVPEPGTFYLLLVSGLRFTRITRFATGYSRLRLLQR
jgi:hypothetical protein